MQFKTSCFKKYLLNHLYEILWHSFGKVQGDLKNSLKKKQYLPSGFI